MNIFADIFDTPTKQEKTYLKPHCTPFPGNMSFNPETIEKHCVSLNVPYSLVLVYLIVSAWSSCDLLLYIAPLSL